MTASEVGIKSLKTADGQGYSPPNYDVAVIIPSFKQPGFLPEAINSVLAQRTELRLAAVIVDDGCPMPETRKVGMAFARSHPGQVFYLRRRNGGLSAARNTGIDFALAAWPECKALYLLDSDNRLHPDFIEKAWTVLEGSPPETGWAYPDIDMFGFGMNFSVRGDYSHFVHLVENYCEAGSLVRRKVFECGLRFDESMRQGFEDWEFWLNCARHGFSGRHIPQSGFQYRRRAESMLTGSERVRESILAYMRKKHEEVLRPASLLAIEHRELPRFAIITGDRADIGLTVDPDRRRARQITPAQGTAMFLEALFHPKAQHFPSFCCFTTDDTLDALKSAKLLQGLFWMAQVMLRDEHAIVAEVVIAPDDAIGLEPLSTRAANGAEVRASPLIIARTAILGAAARDPSPDWLASIEADSPGPRLRAIRVTLPRRFAEAPLAPARHASQTMLKVVADWRSAAAARSPQPAEWREDARRYRTTMPENYGALANLGAVLPYLPPGDRRDIGFVLPLFEFGGVEKVVLNYARVMKEAGWRPHLFITAAQSAHLTEEQREVFGSVNFLLGQGENAADWNDLFFGAGTSAFGQHADTRDVVGLMCSMAVVVNTHSMAAHGVVAALRRQGVKTYLGLHLVERSQLGQPMGNPHIALAYEHAYDGFLLISRQLRDWCAGQAVPLSKLHIIRNAPSYPVAAATVRRSLTLRQRRSGPLRALYLGRLDEQKGLDRLAQVIAQTQGSSVIWRVVGKAILGGAEADLAGSHVTIEPAVTQPHDLDLLYNWADVVVLPSRFEGVPLTILEAQRLGCVVIATDVGAVGEIIEDGVDGYLVDSTASERRIVDAFVQRIARLSDDRALVQRIGATAADRLEAATWSENMRGFLAHLENLLEKRT